MEEKTILAENTTGVLTVTLNRPKANAFAGEMAKTLTKTIKDAGRDESVRVVLLSGAGRM